MNRTDDANGLNEQREIRRFFEERLHPVAKVLRECGECFYAMGPEDEKESWYEGPPDEPDFTSVSEQEVVNALRERWSSQNLPELAEEMLQLARTLPEHKEETPDISPFVYVMY
ncbi:MAG: hypothetical protein D3912_09380 [Candidatus Electrothrix sp. AX1]|nr:hypothetical protein [Candidatus Electrothrix sp. AX1]